MLKRVADWMEKISAGSLLVGLYQDEFYAVAIGTTAFCGMLLLQGYLQRRGKW